jgi:hypothetical protein
MSTITPLPLADPPRPTARPPGPRPTEDQETHLSGGARYAIGTQSRVERPSAGSLNARRHARRRAHGTCP